MSSRWNLLDEPLIRVRAAGGLGPKAMTLPDVLASLAAGDDIVGFRALRHHQRHAWFAFLVQISAMAMHRAGLGSPPSDARSWRKLLVELAGGDAEPYCLLVEDLGRPAFMQPPVPPVARGRLKLAGAAPDLLDILVTSKNHDLKAERIGRPNADQWVFALITVQTMDGYPGRGNYGIARMNGGLGNRPCVAFAPGPGWGPRYRRDVGVLLRSRVEVVGQIGFRDEGGAALLWLLPWDGTAGAAVPLNGCDPFFIEVCRLIRLGEADGSVAAHTAPTDAARTDEGDRHGVLGDPWTPVDREGAKALTLPEAGFDYRRVQELLVGGKYEPGHAQRLAPSDPPTVLFVAEALVRGQGKTGGFHARSVPIPARVRLTLGQKAGRDQVGEMSRRWIELVGLVRNTVLKPAVLVFLQGGPDKLNRKDDRAERWTAALDAAVDRVFFERLFAAVESGVESDVAWARTVLELAQEQLEDAMKRAPVSSVRRYRAESAALRVFHGAARNRLPDLFAETAEGGAAHEQQG